MTPYFERGVVLFRAGLNWVDELEHELLSFPAGKYDDQVDALVHLIVRLQELAPRLGVQNNEGKGIEGMENLRTRIF